MDGASLFESGSGDEARVPTVAPEASGPWSNRCKATTHDRTYGTDVKPGE